MRREYKTGMKWCVWRWKDIYWQGKLYLRRLHVLQTPLFAIMLHFIDDYDRQEHLHDHPVSMISIILKGYYWEKTEQDLFGPQYLRLWFNVIPANRRHRIIGISDGGCVTLVICGPRRQKWGFYTENGWVYWEKYHDLYDGSTS